MTVLGVSAFFHDSAAALCVDGKIIAAAQEERFSRAKGDASFPYSAIEYCCSKLLGQKIDCVALFNDPMKVLDRWMGNLMNQSGNIIDLLDDDNINYWQSSAESLFGQKLWTHAFVNDYFRQRPKFGSPYVCAVPHHLAHAASAFYPSPYDEAAIMVVDGVGEWAATTLGSGIGRKIDFLEQQDYPHSLGLFYSAMTQFCGFDVNFGEYKLMGLAPYGRPVWFEKLLEDVVDVKQDGSLRLDMNYFAFEKEAHMCSVAMNDLFDTCPRNPHDPITSDFADIAASVQAVAQVVLERMAFHLRASVGLENCVMAGGCGLNCAALGAVRQKRIFKNMWVQPAANDSGAAIGAALSCYYGLTGAERRVNECDGMSGSFLGPSYSDEEIALLLKQNDIPYTSMSDEALIEYMASELCRGKIIGLLHGRMEFGPRALGHRSIIASAIDPGMQEKVNAKIKFRESFRPFAPAVLQEDVSDYYDFEGESPYMSFVANVNSAHRSNIHTDGLKVMEKLKARRSDLQSVVHVDYTSRIQTVDAGRNKFFYDLLTAYKRMSGYGIVLNTSFNVRGEPIVCSPQDALKCFEHTNLDLLVMEHCVVKKEELKNVQ